MCGVCGELVFSGRDRVQQQVLEAMRDLMAHRGPDDAGAWYSADGRVGLGHRRLSIIDLSPAGHQPMSNEDGTVWIVFNGEIYNHPDLRPRLERLGHVYRSRCDTETIIHAYEEYGEQCVNHLEGMFAFAIWDENRRRLFLARDHVGIKPLYFWIDRQRFLFASEIKALLRHPSVPKKIDLVATYHYLSLAASPLQQTLFADIHKLEAGHTMSVDLDGRVQDQRYWSPLDGLGIPASYSEEEYANELVHLLTKSIERRMMSDVPFGVFLSGGLDSSINVLLMSQIMDRPVDTFSVALASDTESDEFNWARQVAQYFHCNHHEVVVSDAEFLEFAERMAYFQDTPLADPVCVPLYYVSKLARDSGVIVIQVGEGSDEIFAGYDGYRAVLEREKWANYWQRLVPTPLKRLAVQLATVGGCDKAADFLRRLRDREEIFWGGAVAFYETEKRQIVTDAFAKGVNGVSTWDIVRHFYEEARSQDELLDPLQEMTFIESATPPAGVTAHAGGQDVDGHQHRNARAVSGLPLGGVRHAIAAVHENPPWSGQIPAETGHAVSVARRHCRPQQARLLRLRSQHVT